MSTDIVEVLGSYARQNALSFAGYAFVAVVSFILFTGRKDQLRHIPSPPGASWIWGHERLVFEASVGQAYSSWFTALNSHVIMIKSALWKGDILVISDPLAQAHIQQRNVYHYPRSSAFRRRIVRMLGTSFGSVEGESEHKRMRHLVGPAFSPEVLRASAEYIYGATDALQTSLEKRVNADGGETTLNIQHFVNRATLDVIGRFGFGYDFGSGDSKDAKKIIDTWNNMSKMATSSKGFMAMQLMTKFPIINDLPLKLIKAQGDVRLTIHKGVGEEILRRHNESDELSAARKDLLTLLLTAMNDGLIGEEEMLDHVTMMIMAGYETTSQNVSYALWELARNPEIQERLRAECADYGGEPSYDDMNTKLPFLDAVIREILRLHPAVPNWQREADADDVVPLRFPITGQDGSIVRELHIKKGQTVVIPFRSVNRQSSVWGDGDTFRPQRWLEDLPPSDLLTKGWGSTLAFGDGPRNCVGYKLAIFESKVLLFILLKNFVFHDTGAEFIHKLSSSLQAVVIGEEEKGPQLPLRVTLVQ